MKIKIFWPQSSIEKDTEVKNILKEFNGELIENTIKPNSN